jgi:hypothetical protein
VSARPLNQRRRSSLSRRDDATDVVLGIGVLGARAGGVAARVALGSAVLALRAPVVGPPLRAATRRVAADGRRARIEAELWLHRTVSDAVDSQVTLELTDQVLQSSLVQRAVDHLASSPELRQAVADQTVGMAQQTLEGVRRQPPPAT